MTQAVPSNTRFIGASATSGAGWTPTLPSVGGTGNIEFAKSAVAAGESAEFEIVVLVASDTASGTTINASATAQSATAEANAGDETGTASTTVAVDADLAMTLGDSPDPVDPGVNLAYTIDVTNNGPSDAQSVSVTEAVPANTIFVSASVITGTGWTPAMPSVGSTGNVVFSKSTMPASDMATFEVVVHVDPGATSGDTIDATATATSSSSDSVPGNNTDDETTTVCGAVTIVDYVDTDIVCVGETATFAVTATGDPTPDIQWQVDEGSGFVNLPSETGATLSFTASADQSGNVYRAYVSNMCSEDYTTETTLTVNTGTTITQEPQNTDGCVGMKTVFTLDATGTPEPSIHWQVNDGSGFVDLPGETAKKLKLLDVTEDMDGYVYRAVLSNACGADLMTQEATLTVNAVPEVSTNQLTVGNNPASDYTAASDGTYNDKVQVTWSAVPGADAYRVFRSTKSNFSNAVPVTDWIADLVYDDFDVGTTTSSSGCSSTTVPMLYYYQVKARGICGESDPSGADTGYINISKASYASVLPAKRDDDGYHVAGPTDAIAVRLNAGESIDPERVWANIYSETALDAAGVTIVPAAGGDGNDVWVQYTPLVPWQDGEKITMTAGGVTVNGRDAGTLTAVFRVGSGSAMKLSDLAPQPAYSDFDSSGLDLTVESNDQVFLALRDAQDLPVLPGAVGAAYDVGPATPYRMAQRVWIPVPEGVSADATDVYYFDEDGASGQWLPGDAVDGWLAAPERYVLDVNGQQYLGILVNHGGAIVLGPADANVPAVSKAAVGGLSQPSGFVNLILLLAVAWVGHWVASFRLRRSHRGKE